jgi:preprotein translocase subunit YajC
VRILACDKRSFPLPPRRADVPEPILFALADSAGALFGFFSQMAGDAAGQLFDSVAQAAGDSGVDGGSLGAVEDLGGNFDPLTGESSEAGDAVGAAAESAVTKNQRPPSILESMFANPLLIFGAVMLMLYVFLLSPEKRKQTELNKKTAALKKNDRIVTTGGILGTVVSVSSDSNEVTLRVDDNTNTRIRVLKSAIGNVLDSGKDKSEPSSKSENGLPPSK